MGILLGFVLGVLSSIVANLLKPQTYFFLNKYCFFLKKSTQIVYGNSKQKIFNNVILLDVHEKEFSKIACEFLKDCKYKNFIITNIKEPSWFYRNFKDYVNSEKTEHKRAKLLLKKFENTINNINNSNVIIEELIELFYNGNDINIFPHLRDFANSSVENKNRMNFFDLNLNSTNSLNNFKSRNRDFEVYFFEKFINYKINSYFHDINDSQFDYRGTDALILNNRFILKHDDSINELNYQKNCLIKKTTNGFFHFVVSKKLEEKKTSEILKKVYSINI